jgi:eukaryotic-like serine/threonine-protein kinase
VGIIHRDLKPENVFLAFDASRAAAMVRLLDFGIAKMLDATGPSPRTRTGVVFGTPDYLSPEQATGDVPLDGRSDLFAVGVLIYELVTGTRPFRAPTAVATAFKVVHAEAPSIAAAGVYVDQRLESTVQRLLQKDPARRFPGASDVIRELDRLTPDPARRANALFRALGPARRQGSSGHDSDRSAHSAQPGASPKRHDLVNLPGQGARPHALQNLSPSRAPDVSVSQRVHDSPKSPRHNAQPDLPKTVRSLTIPDNSTEALSSRPTLIRRTPVRAFPQRFVGRFQVRGPVLRSVDKVVTEMFGAEVRNEVVAQMPDTYAADFRNDSINALVAYDLEALDAYMEYATTLMIIDAGKWREIGRQGVDGELYNVVRTLLRPTFDVGSLIRRGVSIWARLFSFGAWRVSSLPSGKVALNIAEFDAVAQPLRQWVVGVVEQTARRAVRSDVRVTITQGDQEFTPELACEIG